MPDLRLLLSAEHSPRFIANRWWVFSDWLQSRSTNLLTCKGSSWFIIVVCSSNRIGLGETPFVENLSGTTKRGALIQDIQISEFKCKSFCNFFKYLRLFRLSSTGLLCCHLATNYPKRAFCWRQMNKRSHQNFFYFCKWSLKIGHDHIKNQSNIFVMSGIKFYWTCERHFGIGSGESPSFRQLQFYFGLSVKDLKIVSKKAQILR